MGDGGAEGEPETEGDPEGKTLALGCALRVASCDTVGAPVSLPVPVAAAEADTDSEGEPDGEAAGEGDAEDWSVGDAGGVGLGVGDRVAPPLGECEGVPEPVRAAQALSEREGEGVTENDAEPVPEGVPEGNWEEKADAEAPLVGGAAAVAEPVGEGKALAPVAKADKVAEGEVAPEAEAEREE